MPKNRFTLIELLVVIAIIAILSGILLPTLNQARLKSKSIACQANLKQFGTAGIMYASENGDYWVPADTTVADYSCGLYYYNNSFRSMLGQGTCLDVYDGIDPKTQKRFKKNILCPLSYSVIGAGNTTGMSYPEWSYGHCYKDLYSYTSEQFIQGAYRISRLKRPSTSIAWGDALDVLIYRYDPTVANGYFSKGETSGLSGALAPRHNMQMNMVFFDGHTSSLGWRQVYTQRYSLFENFY